MRGKAFMLAAALAVTPSMGNLAKTCVGLCTNQCAYEDADNDGICDNIGDTGCSQEKNVNGNGRGAGMGGRGYGNGRHCR